MFQLSEVKRKIKHLLPQPVTDFVLKLKYLNQEVDGYADFVSAVRGGQGLEVGGPSTVFKTILPVYQAVRSLDGVNFAPNTVWEGGIQHGLRFRYLGTRVGYQHIADATDLNSIQSDKYDFVLSSNCLEHVANPIRALLEWKRVMRTGGAFILILPNKASNFDHKRPTTTFEHLLEDFRRNTSEDDLTHVQEILSLHDLSLDPPAGTTEEFRRRSMDNYLNRTLHHHVFDMSTILKLLSHVGFDTARTTTTLTDYFVLASKRA